MKQYVPYIVIGILIASLFIALNRDVEPVVVEKKTTDTITIIKTDTVFYRKPVFVDEVVLDTVFIEKVPENGLKLPITQRMYSGEKYNAWVSGYNPSLDSINVFNNVITNNVITTEVKEIYPNTTDVYFSVGGFIINGAFSPNIGTMVKFKKNISLGAQIGYYGKSAYYGVNVGFKLKK